MSQSQETPSLPKAAGRQSKRISSRAETGPAHERDPRSGKQSGAGSGRWVWLTALGIVYGDLGTSPLYTLQTVAQATGGQFTATSALGVLSLIIWTLIITVSIKYCVFVMRADNHGAGGIMALMSLVGANSLRHGARILTVMGLLGAALIYGDGVITPAISVLSAVEGVNVVSDSLKPFVMPIAVAILLALFAAQRFGTEKIGRAFGPIMLLWFVVIALLGLEGILRNPQSIRGTRSGFSHTAPRVGFSFWVARFCASRAPRPCMRTWVISVVGPSGCPGIGLCCRRCS
jgi:K+ transporter